MLWFILPTILPLLLVVTFPQIVSFNSGELNVVLWVVLILFIDVSHVYSTLYKTYSNKNAIQKHNLLLKITPLICLMVGIFLYSIKDILFWRCVAYLAVFHFIRQQYGFFRLYSRNEENSKLTNQILNYSIYLVTLLPILMWHTQGQKHFNWFVEGDFLYFPSLISFLILKSLYFVTLGVYIVTELIIYYKSKAFNLPRFLLTTGTALSWYIGIVEFNADIVFTSLNVIAHGIPYMALIWVTERPNAKINQKGVFKVFFSTYGVILFVGFLLILAFVEEGIWDAIVWRDNQTLFQGFYFLHSVTDTKWLSLLVPILSLPQIVHYVLDGFIWKRDRDNSSIST